MTDQQPILTAQLKDKDLKIIREIELPDDTQFPDMIELGPAFSKSAVARQFFRIGITDKRGFYREGTSYRIEQ